MTIMKIEEESSVACIEQEDFKSMLYRLCHTIKQLVEAREDTIAKLLVSADYLDSLWLRCKVSKAVGTSVSVVGGGLTIAGGIMTAMTAGAAAPVLIAGLATSSVGTAATVGTSLVERVINSNQIKDMNAALKRDKEISNKLEYELQQVCDFRESKNLHSLLLFAKELLGDKHLVIVILENVLAPLIVSDMLEGHHEKEANDSAKIRRETLLKQTSADCVESDLLGSDVLMEGGKVIGQSIGFSVAFLVWDAKDLGMNISDIVTKEGSQAAKVLRGKAAVLDCALQSTVGVYSVNIPE